MKTITVDYQVISSTCKKSIWQPLLRSIIQAMEAIAVTVITGMELFLNRLF